MQSVENVRPFSASGEISSLFSLTPFFTPRHSKPLLPEYLDALFAHFFRPLKLSSFKSIKQVNGDSHTLNEL